MKRIAFILITTLFFACKKQEGIIIPDQDKVLVVNSGLCADSVLRINLSYTQSITDNSQVTYETKADIVLYDKDTVFLENLMNNGDGNYRTINQLSTGRTYILKIIIFDKIFWSNDSIPSKVDGLVSGVDTSIVFRDKSNFLQIHYSLNDKQSYRNYYGFKLKHCFEEYHLNDTIQKEEWIDIETLDPILIEDINSKFSKQQLLFTDKYFNTQTVEIKFGTSEMIHNSAQKSKRLIVYTEHYTANAFAYYSSVNEHIFYQNDPFSQPISVKGNVSNAYGAFVGKNIKADTINLNF